MPRLGGKTGILNSIANLMKTMSTGLISKIGTITKKVTSPVANVGKGLRSVGGKLAAGVTTPFKKVGSFMSKLNPFKRAAKPTAALARV